MWLRHHLMLDFGRKRIEDGDRRRSQCFTIRFLPRSSHHNHQYMCFNINNWFSENIYQSVFCGNYSLRNDKNESCEQYLPIWNGLMLGDTEYLVIAELRANLWNRFYLLANHWCVHSYIELILFNHFQAGFLFENGELYVYCTFSIINR